ncbi:major histocompatibility complex class I-related gene protein-like isoform X2 [Megalops cyprinoides]|uniref:major histocompatibility complex class I-related gene protein-like isoform X2 n=1 Tax=Megalops cyprinoides TaxID=118141 RepID=UPI0018642EBE|nr:major histocompatibility complex class I-related gene protein-like isoform X2 [Megalops cyprinoides]
MRNIIFFLMLCRIHATCAGLGAFPDFVAVVLVDEDAVAYFDSSIKCLQTRQQWAENIEETFTDVYNELMNSFMQALKSFWKEHLEPHNQGIHTFQLMFACQLDDEGKTGGYRLMFGVDGEDFFTLDTRTFTWIAANQMAEDIVKQDQNSAENAAIYVKILLENECTEALNVFIHYGRESLERKVPPEVSLLRRDPSSPVTCLATGFFPEGIAVSWQKDGKDLHEDVELLETVPNENGTFQTRNRLTVSPADLKEHNYTCTVGHNSLERKIIKTMTEEEIKTNLDPGNFSLSAIIGVVVAIFLLAIISIAGVMLWRRRRVREL